MIIKMPLLPLHCYCFFIFCFLSVTLSPSVSNATALNSLLPRRVTAVIRAERLWDAYSQRSAGRQPDSREALNIFKQEEKRADEKLSKLDTETFISTNPYDTSNSSTRPLQNISMASLSNQKHWNGTFTVPVSPSGSTLSRDTVEVTGDLYRSLFLQSVVWLINEQSAQCWCTILFPICTIFLWADLPRHSWASG